MATPDSTPPTSSPPSHRLTTHIQPNDHSNTLPDMLQVSHDYINHYIPPSTRSNVKQRLSTFATEHPYVASFLVAQVSFCAPPIALFLFTTAFVVAFSIIPGIMIGLLGALLFIVFFVGFGLLLLLPTICFMTVAAVGLWFWGVVGYSLYRWYIGKPLLVMQNYEQAGAMEEKEQPSEDATRGQMIDYLDPLAVEKRESKKQPVSDDGIEGHIEAMLQAHGLKATHPIVDSTPTQTLPRTQTNVDAYGAPEQPLNTPPDNLSAPAHDSNFEL